jgi:hypothetical protein
MSWGKLKFISIFLFVLFCALHVPNVSGHEYDHYDGNGFLLFEKTAFSEPYDPKIACHPAGFHCLALVYENNAFFGRGVKVWFSNDFFKTFWGRSQITSVSKDYSSFLFGYYDNYHLPYDVTYTNSKYYFFVENSVYSYDGITLTSEGYFESAMTGNRRWGLGFIDDDSVRTFESINAVNTASFPFSTFKGAVLSDRYTITANWTGGSGNPTLRKSINNIVNRSAETGYTGICSGTGLNGCFVTDLPSFPTNYSGLDYFDGDYVHYQIDHNSSWKVTTTDMANYGTPELVYNWLIVYGVFINFTDSAITEKNRIYLHNWEDGNPSYDGIYVYNLPLTRIVTFGEGYDIANKKTDLINLSVSLSCSNQSWNISDQGIYSETPTPCQTDNLITISSFIYQPNFFVMQNFSMPTSCVSKTNYIRTTIDKAYYKPYNFTITLLDEFFGNAVSGATINLNGETETTDSEGKTTFEVFPINSPNFTQEAFEEATCTQYLSFTGTPSEYVLIASKSNYETKTENFQLAKSPFNVEEDFTSSKTIFLEPENTKVEVFLFSKDGIELKPTNVEVNVSGSNTTFWVFGNEWFEQSNANSVPALFYLLNNTGTYSITIALTYFGTYTQTINVTTGNYHEVKFYLNYSSWELPCYADTDCQPNMCVGKFLKKFNGCKSNVCNYQTIDCGTSAKCDSELGCVDLVSLTSCTKDQDCQNYCLDNYTMVDYKCGETGYCKGKYVDCEINCNASLGYCEEYAGCLNPVKTEFKIGYYRNDGFFVGTSFLAYCDFEFAEKHTCSSAEGITITKAQLEAETPYFETYLTFNDIIARPKGWEAEFRNNGNDLHFYPVSIYCDKYCNMTWEYCKNGCEVNSGYCKGTEAVINDIGVTAGRDIWQGFVLLYNGIFPDIHSRSFMWFIYAMLIYIAFITIKMKVMPKQLRSIALADNHFGELMFMLVWFLIGSVFGQFYWFIWFAVVIIAVYLMAKHFTPKKQAQID